MNQFLTFDDETSARKRNRELMETKRKLNNPDGDGKPYGTLERHTLRVADDGQAILEIKDDSQLTFDEKKMLIEIRPSKFDPPEEEELRR